MGIWRKRSLPKICKIALSDQFYSDKPFMISPERAAYIIVVNDVDKNKTSISFPFPLHSGI